MSVSGSGKGGAPKRPGAGKPNKGYPKVSGEDDATIDLRKKQQPPAELPPIQEPANEPPADPVPSSESVGSEAPSEAGTAPPEPPVQPQDDTETDGGAIPLPPSAAVPHALEGLPGNALPQTVEEDRPSDPSRSDRSEWMDMPEANASAFGAEKVLPPADAMAGQTPPNAEDRSNGTDVWAMDEAGSGKVDPKGLQGPFFSLGEGQEQFGGLSRESRRLASRESINPIPRSFPTVGGSVRKAENEGAGAPVLAKSALGLAPVDRVPPVVGALANPHLAALGEGSRAESVRWKAVEGTNADNPEGTDAKNLLAGEPRSANALAAVKSKWGKFGGADVGQRIIDRQERVSTIVQVKSGLVIARSETGETFRLRQGDARLLDGPSASRFRDGAARKDVAMGKQVGARESKVLGRAALLTPETSEEASSVAEVGGFRITRKFLQYLQAIERITKRQLPPPQLVALLSNVAKQRYYRLSTKDGVRHTARFSTKVKNELIAEWERQTEQEWPRYEKDIYSAGLLRRKAGDPYDAHHIVHQKYGGPHEWWNLTPARFQTEHPAIHSAVASKTLFP